MYILNRKSLLCWLSANVLYFLTVSISSSQTAYLDYAKNLSEKDYTYGYYKNGWRKNTTDETLDELSFETGHYGFSINVDNFKKCRYGVYGRSLNYEKSLMLGNNIQNSLQQAALNIELKTNGKLYSATTCKAGITNNLSSVRLLESGRYMQHFDLQDLVFKDDKGNQLHTDGTLSIIAWPKNITFNLSLAPTIPLNDSYTLGAHKIGKCVSLTPYRENIKKVKTDQNLTFDFWYYAPSKSKQESGGFIASINRQTGVNGFVGVKKEHNKTTALMNVGGQELAIKSFKKINHDTWQHYAVTYKNGEMCYYIDGVLMGKKKTSKIRKSANRTILYLGGIYSERHISSGIYDQCNIWDIALNSSQIKNLASQPTLKNVKPKPIHTTNFDNQKLTTKANKKWQDSKLTISLTTAHINKTVSLSHSGHWQNNYSKYLTLQVEARRTPPLDKIIKIKTSNPGSKNIETIYSTFHSSFVSIVNKVRRSWEKGYTDIRNYDDFNISLTNKSNKVQYVPFTLEFNDPANITGLCPILCYKDGTPTGIPVQLSKNWHHQTISSYVRAFSIIPIPKGKHEFILRFAYGFYGEAPSASHAQLSLVGYGGQARWDQLAIGCWGETMCFDTDMSCVKNTITDVRLLMVKKWGWTDAGWGGDWLGLFNAKGEKFTTKGVKTQYKAHGPCLSDVSYTGTYGTDNNVRFKVQLQTLRTDDYARTFQKCYYKFTKDTPAKDAWFFKLGGTHNLHTETLSYGNGKGLTKQIKFIDKASAEVNKLQQQTMKGQKPFWIGFPKTHFLKPSGKGIGSRALIVRKYYSKLNGTVYHTPTFSTPIHKIEHTGQPNLDIIMTPPSGITEFKKGDVVSFDLEWVTFPFNTESYIGPNKAFSIHLKNNPSSWKTIFREASKNNLTITAKGAKVIKQYPVLLNAESQGNIEFSLEGGVGYVPITIDNLDSNNGYTLYKKEGEQLIKLDQSVHGNDFWQTDYNSSTKKYSITYTIPLDNVPISQWLFKKTN